MFTATTATRKVAALTKRIRLLAGGTSASKTISIELVLIALAQTDYDCNKCGKHGCTTKDHNKQWTMKPKLTSIVSESMPHLRRGAMRDFMNIMQTHKYWNDDRWNASTFTYTFETGSQIEFFSADQPSKVRGPRRDRLFCNEVNNIARESWEQLVLRTRELAFGDWNPVNDFYMYEDYGLDDEHGATSTDPDCDFLILTYKDNESLEAAIVKEIERRAELNPGWGKVYAEGKRGDVADKIFKGWKIIDEIPHEATLQIRGLDFGYAQDPTALCDIYTYNGGYIIDERAYRLGLKDRQLSDIILNQPDPNVLTIADSAEPKAIETMAEYGCNIIGVEKKGVGGLSFTNAAIKWVQGQQMSITKRSINYIDSYRNFMWKVDKDGNQLTPPKYDHFKSDGMMSVVYGMTNFRPREVEEEDTVTTGNMASLWS